MEEEWSLVEGHLKKQSSADQVGVKDSIIAVKWLKSKP